MPKCAIKMCRNNTLTTQKKHGVTYHRFPEIKREDWRKLVAKERSEEFYNPNKSSVICSDHFLESDIYYTTKGFKRLKKTAVPHIKTVPRASTQSLGQQSQEHDHGNVQKSTLNVPDKQLDLKSTDYRCNECNSDIFGFRYVCVQCVDHDVCATCEARGEHALHYVLRAPADKPHREVMAVLEKIRQIINIERQEDQDVPLDELESVKCEADTLCDPLQVEDTVKEEPQEFSEVELTQTDEETNIKGFAQPDEPKKCPQPRKHKAPSPEKHTDLPPVTLPNTQIKISLERVTEVMAKRNKTQCSRASRKKINEQTPLTYKVPADVNVNAQKTFNQGPVSVVPVLMYNIPKCEDRGELQPEMRTLATSSCQTLVISLDPSQSV